MRGEFLILFTFLLFSCNQKTFDNSEELQAYVINPENGYSQTKQIRGVDISLMYRPIDLLVTQELSENYTEKTIDSLRNKYSRYLYFNLSFKKNNKELLSTIPKDQHEFGSMVNALSFEMGKKIHLYTQSMDTIEMIDYVYPRMYGLSKNTSLLLVYPKEDKIINETYFTISIEDFGLNTGDVKFKIENKLIEKQPKISFSNPN